MKSIRIGNDIRIEWPVKLGAGIEGLEGLDLSVYVRPSEGIVDYHNYEEHPTVYRQERVVIMNGGMVRRLPGDGKERPRHRRHGAGAPVRLPHKVVDGKIIAWWRADRQFATGEYDIMLYARKNEVGQGVCDQCRFVRLVAHSAQADLPDDSGVEAVIEMQPLTLGLSGLSAYEIALIHGFTGTEKEWVESLKPDNLTDVKSVPDADGVDLEFYTSKGGGEPTITERIEPATAKRAGAMSAKDKEKLDDIDSITNEEIDEICGDAGACCCEAIPVEEVEAVLNGTGTGDEPGEGPGEETCPCGCEAIPVEEVEEIVNS